MYVHSTYMCMDRYADMELNWESSYPTRLHFLARPLPKVWGLALSSAISGQKFRQILNQSNKNALFMLKRLEGLWHVVSGEEASALRAVSPTRVAGVKVPTCRHRGFHRRTACSLQPGSGTAKLA